MNTETPQPKTGAPMGFSLVEVLAAITIIGIITFLAIPNILRLKQDGEDNLARARAETLNMAIASYIQAVGPSTAQTNWSTRDNNGRFDLLVPYIAFAETNLAAFMPGDYQVTLPTSINPPSKATLLNPQGTAVAY